MTKLKITLFHLFVVLAALLTVGLSVWTAVSVSTKLSAVDSSVGGDADAAPDNQPVVQNVVPVAAEKIDMTGIDFDFTPYKNTNAVANTSSALRAVNLSVDIANAINWFLPRKIEKLGFFGANLDTVQLDMKSGEKLSSDYESKDYYLGGVFNYQDKSGAVVFADVDCVNDFGCGSQNPDSMFILYDGKIILLQKYSALNFGGWIDPLEFIDRERVLVDKDFDIAYLNFPKEIPYDIGGGKFSYIKIDAVGSNFGEDFLLITKVYSDSVFGDFYLGNEKKEWEYRNFYVRGRDGRIRTYQYMPDIVDKDGLADVIFSDGKKIEDYNFWMKSGCGGVTAHAIIPGTVDSARDLKEVGKTANGAVIYGLADSNHKLLRDFYDQTFYPGQEGKISYEEFISARPAVFWTDPFGRLIMLQLNKFQPAAECGKPVIYLYPQSTTKVSVKLALSKLTVSEPDYDNGWAVVANPNGELTETKSGAKYPYLFWEGLGVGEAEHIAAGFNVKKENVSKFLDEKLTAQGLNQKEIFDFKEFWLPKMQSAPYYFVTFYGTSDMNKIAPLYVSPRPDTVIRVLMDYRALSVPLNRPEQKLSALPRKGFTVIEWGGVLYR